MQYSKQKPTEIGEIGSKICAELQKELVTSYLGKIYPAGQQQQRRMSDKGNVLKSLNRDAAAKIAFSMAGAPILK